MRRFSAAEIERIYATETTYRLKPHRVPLAAIQPAAPETPGKRFLVRLSDLLPFTTLLALQQMGGSVKFLGPSSPSSPGGENLALFRFRRA